MRKIKFRQWDMGAMQVVTRLDLVFPNVHGELMQYTGLKDKHGKEIYEGDIVDDRKGFGEVGFAPPHFCVKTSNGAYWQLGGGCAFPDNYQLAETEVIGNIYENPELLEREK